MSEPIRITRVDGVNYVSREIPTADGKIRVEGLTVRALIKALQQADPDDLVCYMAEVTPEMRKMNLLIGCTGGVMTGSPYGVTFIVGPEAVNLVKNGGLVEGDRG